MPQSELSSPATEGIQAQVEEFGHPWPSLQDLAQSKSWSLSASPQTTLRPKRNPKDEFLLFASSFQNSLLPLRIELVDGSASCCLSWAEEQRYRVNSSGREDERPSWNELLLRTRVVLPVYICRAG